MNQFWIFLSTYSGIKLELTTLIIFFAVYLGLGSWRLTGSPARIASEAWRAWPPAPPVIYKLFVRAATLLAVFVIFRLMGEAIKLGVAAPRPCWRQEMPGLMPCPESFSFPSGHALGAMMAAVIMGLISRKKIVWTTSLLIAVLISWSRVVVGVHWPVDVIGGGLLGAGFGWLGWRFYWK